MIPGDPKPGRVPGQDAEEQGTHLSHAARDEPDNAARGEVVEVFFCLKTCILLPYSCIISINIQLVKELSRIVMLFSSEPSFQKKQWLKDPFL